jgi:argininosuccinate lyase
MVAIDIAEELVSQGVPFRQAHEQVGRLVGEAVTSQRTLCDVVREHPDFERFVGLFEPGVALSRRRSPGSSGPQSAGAQRDLLARTRARLEERLAHDIDALPDEIRSST